MININALVNQRQPPKPNPSPHSRPAVCVKPFVGPLLGLYEVSFMSLRKVLNLNQDDDREITDIEIEDIPKDMPMYNFMGKTIEKILLKGPLLDMKFTDGTYGHVSAVIPNEISREDYNRFVEEGSFGIIGYCSDDPLFSGVK